jgi:catechol 2,3-dioxygenase
MNPSEPSGLRLAAVELRVPDLARSVEFYAGKLGFTVAAREDSHAELAVEKNSAAILTLTADRAAATAPREAAGLFHAALLLPSRGALGAWLKFAAERGVEFDGFSDHGVSEAIYFSDPDGNGLEFYCDRARAAWPFAPNGELAMVTQPLALPSLLAAASSANATPLAGARWGHLHLRVTDLARSEKFYRDALGVALTQGSYPGARFLAADGYHHHLGLNSWGAPRLPQPAGALGLARATFSRAGSTEKILRDPDGLALRLIAA